MRIHGEARENSDGDSMSQKIGRFTPGTANVPLPQTDQGRRVRELLKNPGGLLTAKVLIGNVKVETGETKAQPDSTPIPGLFPDDPYADESSTATTDNLFDSDGKKPSQPASVAVPIAHHAEVPPLSQEYRSWARQFVDKPVDEAEVAKVRDLLGLAQPRNTGETPHKPFPERLVDEAEVAKVTVLLRQNPQQT
jgi:hypothetical protein